MSIKKEKYLAICIDCKLDRLVSYTTNLETKKGLRAGRCQSCAEIYKRCFQCKVVSENLIELKDRQHFYDEVETGVMICRDCEPNWNKEIWTS